MKLSDNEMQIMELLWREQKPLSRQDILQGVRDCNWNPASTNMMLNNMLRKGAIRTVSVQRGRYGRKYKAILTHDEYMANCVIDNAPDQPEKDRLMSVVCGFASRRKLSRKDIAELKDYLEELERQEELEEKKQQEEEQRKK